MGSDMSAPETGDALNLAGILNTLDGVVDTPGRLLVMTSNHPEKLDPALIRPGRIDKMFHLSYMVGEQACHMMAHYFQQDLCVFKFTSKADGRSWSWSSPPAAGRGMSTVGIKHRRSPVGGGKALN